MLRRRYTVKERKKLVRNCKMARFEIVAVSLILAVTLNFMACSSDEIDSNIEISIVPDMAKYMMENPGQKMQPLITDISGVAPYNQKKYTLGARVAGKIEYKPSPRIFVHFFRYVWIPGDRLVGTASVNQKWTSPRNVRAGLNYPSSGPGAVISYIEVLVDQVKYVNIAGDANTIPVIVLSFLCGFAELKSRTSLYCGRWYWPKKNQFGHWSAIYTLFWLQSVIIRLLSINRLI